MVSSFFRENNIQYYGETLVFLKYYLGGLELWKILKNLTSR